MRKGKPPLGFPLKKMKKYILNSDLYGVFFLATCITKVYSEKAGKLRTITICFEIESLIQNFMSFTSLTIPEIHPFHLHLLHEQQYHHNFHHYRQLCKNITSLIMSKRELKGDGPILLTICTRTITCD